MTRIQQTAVTRNTDPPVSRLAIFVGLSAAFFMLLVAFPRVLQNHGYHAFADQRSWSGIPNAANVLSSLPLTIIGILGVALAVRRSSGGARRTAAAAFLGLLMTGLGSAYYHVAPSSERLFWDRLPLGLAVMSLLTLAMAWHISDAAHRLLAPLLGCAVAAAAIWRFGASPERADLKWWWGTVEVYPVFAILLLMILFRTSPRRTRVLFLMLACFASAQLFDTADSMIFASTGVVSGHSLKHLAGAVAALILLLAHREWTTPELRPVAAG